MAIAPSGANEVSLWEVGMCVRACERGAWVKPFCLVGFKLEIGAASGVGTRVVIRAGRWLTGSGGEEGKTEKPPDGERDLKPHRL